MKKIFKEIKDHLREDIKGYSQARKHLKKEAQEDRNLIKKLAHKAKIGKKK